MSRDKDWDELQGRPHKRRPSKGNKKRSLEEQLDSDFAHDEQTKFLDGLAHKGGKYEWMRGKTLQLDVSRYRIQDSRRYGNGDL